MTRDGVHGFLKCFNERGCMMRALESGRPSKVTLEIKRLVEQQMRLDYETMATQLHSMLVSK